jgi:hypothetical protein
MSPEDLQTYFVETVLYYVSLFESTRYFGQDPYDLSPLIGTRNFPDPEVPVFAVATWELTSCTMPTNTELEAYALVDVLDFYTNCYKNPQLVLNAQPFQKLTQTEVTELETSYIPSGSIINNTTNTQNEILYNSEWVGFPNRSLQTYVRHGTFTSAYDASEVKSVPFTCTNKESIGFTLNTATAVTTYNGPTQKFKLKFIFGIQPNNSASTGELHSFVNINSESTSIPSSQAIVSSTFIGSDLGRQNICLEDVLTLNTTDTVSLGGYLASGIAQDVDYFNVYAEFSPM